MRALRIVVGLAATIILSGFTRPVLAAPQIVDGGFEDYSAARNNITDITGTGVPGWSGDTIGGVRQYIVNGEVRIADGSFEGQTPFGSQYLVLEQIAHRSFRSIESQTLGGFDAGATYEISLYFASLNNAGGTGFGASLPPELSLAVTNGSDGSGDSLAYQTYDATESGPFGRGEIPFTKVTLDFKALSDTSTFSLGNQSYYSALGIDNVSLREIPAAPEPAIWTLCLLGIGLVGAALRAQSRRCRTGPAPA